MLTGLVLAANPAASRAQNFTIHDLVGKTTSSIDLRNPLVPDIQDSDEILPVLDTLAFSEVQSPFGEVLDARAAAFQNTFGINAAFAELRRYVPELRDGFNITATTEYRIRVKSNQSLTRQVPFEFVINSGQLRIDDYERYTPFGSFGGAKVEARIGLDGVPWEFSAQLTKDTSTNTMVVELDNVDPLGLDIFPALTIEFVDADGDALVDDAVVNIPQIKGLVMIDGKDFSGNGVAFSYQMEADFEMVDVVFNGSGITTGLAGITDPFALGTPDDTSDDLGAPFDPAGVQFFLDGQPLSAFPVPEPSTAALLGLGLLGLAVRLRRA
ncbi:MAG: PEP-CTERM sorting domain-containing protein [Burkholderiaceae bacterium]|nr:PEP-CTERM sorting domain-containing protein [Burkholderiaceae bacterium]